MAHWAKPGVKCVCIEGGSPNCDGFLLFGSYPVTGATYTITAVHVGRTKTLLSLAEFGDLGTGGWDAERFRPIVTRTQEDDVALFAPILTTREREST